MRSPLRVETLARLGVALVPAFVVGWLGCVSAQPIEDSSPPPPPGVGVANFVTVSPDPASIGIGDSLRFTAAVRTGQAKRTTWAVSDTLVAVVDSGGLLRALRAGTVAVRATVILTDQTSASGAATLTVR